jgi:hypothetical protein
VGCRRGATWKGELDDENDEKNIFKAGDLNNGYLFDTLLFRPNGSPKEHSKLP